MVNKPLAAAQPERIEVKLQHMYPHQIFVYNNASPLPAHAPKTSAFSCLMLEGTNL